ncbi:hypothetical protein [Kineosporia succinea]|uniref:Uncharacterized protein n=1 Tax=Kineosporia succinea TaxID=84632 RepID=A0ABT9NWA2_9ACTN|nr:hypothetical protein [Kineosporia succinea]MDP9824703.1 hypothetical protein [Kineosporia succinea]
MGAAPYEPDWISAGISFWWVLSRDEVIAALGARGSLLEARPAGLQFASAGFDPSAAGTPAHVAEMFPFQGAMLRAEVEGVRAVRSRVRDGEYGFAGEDPARIRPGRHPMRPADENPGGRTTAAAAGSAATVALVAVSLWFGARTFRRESA